MDDFPIHKAISEGNLEIVKNLISEGWGIESRNQTGATPLVWAATQGPKDGEIVKFLIKAGADVEAEDFWGNRALRWASFLERNEIESMLKQAGAIEWNYDKPQVAAND